MPGSARKNRIPKQPVDLDASRVFLHMQFHPLNPPLSKIQDLFHTICKPIFENEDHDVPVCNLTIAYSNPPNISDLCKANCIKPTENTTPSKIHTHTGMSTLSLDQPDDAEKIKRITRYELSHPLY